MKKLVDTLRLDFPIFQQQSPNGKPWIYFDSAATAQMPMAVMQAMTDYYLQYKANIDRGVYGVAEKATSQYEQGRSTIAQFICAASDEIIFTQGATDGINTVAAIWANIYCVAGDEIMVSQVEHHSNFLVWQRLAQEKKLRLTILPVMQDGRLDIDFYNNALSVKTKLVAITHASNIFGTINDIRSITIAAHQVGAKVLVDAAQSIVHQSIDVQKLGCDFLVFSGHKLYGPTGVGILFIKKEIMKQCVPYTFGGGMVVSAGYERSVWKDAPYCFEAGTPPIAQVIGLAASVTYLQNNVDFSVSYIYEQSLALQASQGLQKLGYHLLQSQTPSHIVTFYSNNVHAHDIAQYLSFYGIAVRAGNHCVQPYHEKLGIQATVRLSFAFYNTADEVAMFLHVMQGLSQ